MARAECETHEVMGIAKTTFSIFRASTWACLQDDIGAKTDGNSEPIRSFFRYRCRARLGVHDVFHFSDQENVGQASAYLTLTDASRNAAQAADRQQQQQQQEQSTKAEILARVQLTEQCSSLYATRTAKLATVAMFPYCTSPALPAQMPQTWTRRVSHPTRVTGMQVVNTLILTFHVSNSQVIRAIYEALT